MAMTRLAGKVAIVTGGGQGIGQAIVERFVNEGASVAVVDISGEEKNVAGAHGDSAIGIRADVSVADDVAQMIDETRAAFGGWLDVLCNNAGVDGPTKPLGDYEVEEFERLVNVNLRGVFLGMKYALPVMAAQGGGSIVNTASALSYLGMPGQATYAGTKAGVVQMSRTAAWEYGGRGVRVNALSPGGVLTAIAERFFADNPEHEAAYTACHALGRLADPAEIAAAALFLASDDASFVTGINLPVDAGWNAH
jgi:NAD(P)-dependent dehydrogenase (short-subunit alcohol dehydrogenase family)